MAKFMPWAAAQARTISGCFDRLRALVYTRDAGGRLGFNNAEPLAGSEAAIEMPEYGVILPFAMLYEGLTFA